jgi:SAM-dependent methyltransferase
MNPPTLDAKQLTAAPSSTAQGRLAAALLHRAEGYMDRKYGPRKRAVFATLPDEILEVGAGTGANMRYYRSGTRLIAVEPNPQMHPHLRKNAARYQIALDIRQRYGESMDLADESVPAVVGTLVLCSVADPRQVVEEVHRVLKPGGPYIFFEHVAALPGTGLRSLQDRIARLWQWLFDGCHLNRNTHRILSEAGFSALDMDCFKLRSPLLPVTPHIFGTAVK